jgi:CubicO group peptidase (beta-lactamase class C family)
MPLADLIRPIVAAVAAVSLPLAGCARSRVQIESPVDPSRAVAVCSSTPEEQGIDSNALARALREMGDDSKGLHSLLAIRNGCVVLEAYWPPYHREQKHYLNSATKAVLSALIGIAIHDGRLREDDFVASYFPEHVAVDADPRKRRIRIKHLLTMSSGIFWPQTRSVNASDEMGRSSDWVRFILDRPMAAEPGSVANYSNGDSHLLSAILQKATGTTALDFARKRLFEPQGISDVAWDSDPQGRSIGSAALQMRPVDMAKFGSLYLSYGEWERHGVVERAWVEKSLTAHVKMPTSGGPADYGYYWWLYPDRGLFEAWGGAGQRIGVLRSIGVVVVMTADLPNDIPRSPFAARLYEKFRQSVKSSHQLPASPSAFSDLQRSIRDLTTPLAKP